MYSATAARRRSVMAGCAALTCILSTSLREPLVAEQVAAKKCSTAITFVSSQNLCPTAPIEFHATVSGCRQSSGTFDYTYIAVNQETKIDVRRSAQWLRDESSWQQIEHVPLACGTEIYHVTPLSNPSCDCRDP